MYRPGNAFVFIAITAVAITVAGCQDDESCISCVPDPGGLVAGIPESLDLSIESPARAAMLEQGGMEPDQLLVSGRVCDPADAITTLRINGVDLPVDPAGPCSPFETAVESRWGLNLIEGMASNASGSTVLRAQSFMRSPSWFAAPSAPSARSADAAVDAGGFLLLGQDLFDDQDRLDPDDLATIIEMLVAQVDLDDQMPPTLVNDVSWRTYDCILYDQRNGSGARVTRTGPMTSSSVTIDWITVKADHLALRLSIHNLRLPIKVRYHQDNKCLGEVVKDFYGRVDVDRLTVTTELVPGIGADDQLELVARNTKSTLTGYDYTLDGFDLGGVIEGYVGGKIESGLKSGIGPLVEVMLNERLGEVLALFQVPERIELPEPIGVVLLLDTGVDGVRMAETTEVADGFLEFTSRLGVRPETVAPGHAPVFGSIEGGGTPPVLDDRLPTFAMALKEDLFNQMMWAVWLGGGMDFDSIAAVTGISALTGLEVSGFAHLPPLIMPGDSDGGIKLGIGDYYGELVLTSEVMDQAIAMFELSEVAQEFAARGNARSACLGVGAIVGAYLSFVQDGILEIATDTGKFEFQPTGAPEVAVEIVGLDDALCAAVLGNYVRETIGSALPHVLSLIIDSFPAPVFDLGVLDPSLASISWGLGSFTLERLDRYQCVTGTLSQDPIAGGLRIGGR